MITINLKTVKLRLKLVEFQNIIVRMRFYLFFFYQTCVYVNQAPATGRNSTTTEVFCYMLIVYATQSVNLSASRLHTYTVKLKGREEEVEGKEGRILSVGN